MSWHRFLLLLSDLGSAQVGLWVLRVKVLRVLHSLKLPQATKEGVTWDF